jgi:hypothetical protein
MLHMNFMKGNDHSPYRRNHPSSLFSSVFSKLPYPVTEAGLKAPTYTGKRKNKSEMHKRIHASNGIRTHDLGSGALEDILFLSRASRRLLSFTYCFLHRFVNISMIWLSKSIF